MPESLTTLQLARRPDAVSFFVPGIPRPKGSSSAYRVKGTNRVVVTSACRGLKAWEADVRALARMVRPRTEWLGAVRLSVSFYFPRPKSVTKRAHPSVKPDLSKLIRGIEDALTGVIYKDDAQIVSVTATKYYDVEGKPGAVIEIREV